MTNFPTFFHMKNDSVWKWPTTINEFTQIVLTTEPFLCLFRFEQVCELRHDRQVLILLVKGLQLPKKKKHTHTHIDVHRIFYW